MKNWCTVEKNWNGKFQLDIRKKSFTVWVIEHRKHRKNSWFLLVIFSKILWIRLAMILSDLLCVGPWTVWILKVLLNLPTSMLLLKDEPLCRYRENLKGGKYVYWFRWDQKNIQISHNGSFSITVQANVYKGLILPE